MATAARCRRSWLLAITLLLGLTAFGCAEQEEADDLGPGTAAGVERLVERATEETVAGVLVHVDAPAGVLTESEGIPEAREDAASAAAFRIASITKMFTGVIVLQLVEEGALALDERLDEILPGQADRFEFGADITVRQLLAHTSGLHDFIRDPAYLPDLVAAGEVVNGTAVGTCEDLAGIDPLEYVEGDAAFAPGDGYQYSNAGYVLAGEVIEVVTGGTLADAYRDRILAPLGMEGTWLTCEEEPRGELVPAFHAPGSFGFTVPGQGDEPIDVTDVEDPNLGAAAGLVSTAADLAVFARGLFDGELFDDPATLDVMVETSAHAAYGLGVRDYGDAYGHGGLAAGYGTHLRYDAAEDAIVVVMVNETAETLPGALGSDIVDVVAGTRQESGQFAPFSPSGRERAQATR